MRRVLWFLPALAALACEYPYAPGLADIAADLLERKGEIAAASDSLVERRDGVEFRDVRITSTSGLEVAARLRLPAGASPGDGRTAVVLAGGLRTGEDAVRLLPAGIDEVAAAIRYPIDPDLSRASLLERRMAVVRDAALDVPASLMLLADYLAARPEVAPDRLAFVGASLGGFFGPVTAAVDRRFLDVALLYTGADLRAILESNLDADAPAAAVTLGAELALLQAQWLEPGRHVGRIAPRHVLIVNGLDDERIPRGSAERLIRAARQPKDVVWLPTRHLEPSDTVLIRALVDSAFSRLPLLRGTR